jgi:ribonuclease P protein component
MVLAPPETLKRRADFLRLASRGRKAARPGFVLQGLNGEAELRVGYTASRKIGNAVARNRARRRLKEAARLTLAALRRSGQGPSGELVLICRRETATVPFPLLCASLRSAILDLAK